MRWHPQQPLQQLPQPSCLPGAQLLNTSGSLLRSQLEQRWLGGGAGAGGGGSASASASASGWTGATCDDDAGSEYDCGWFDDALEAEPLGHQVAGRGGPQQGAEPQGLPPAKRRRAQGPSMAKRRRKASAAAAAAAAGALTAEADEAAAAGFGLAQADAGAVYGQVDMQAGASMLSAQPALQLAAPLGPQQGDVDTLAAAALGFGPAPPPPPPKRRGRPPKHYVPCSANDPYKNGVHRYRGAYFQQDKMKWRAQLQLAAGRKFLG